MNALLETPAPPTKTFCDRAANSRHRILVVDDDIDLRHLVVEVLIGSGYEVDDADNGARAWKALHLKHYDLVMTDHEMPEMTGLQLVDKLRKAGFEIPVIFASGSLHPEVMAKSVWLKLVTLLPKPFTLEELRQTVGQLLSIGQPAFSAALRQPMGGLPLHQENFRRC